MFNCPFFFRLPQNYLGPDEKVQSYLDGWRKREGDEWLDSVGPVLKRRELRNIERSKLSKAQVRELSQN